MMSGERPRRYTGPTRGGGTDPRVVHVAHPAGTILLVVLIASVGVALGTLWEVREWISDQLFTRASAIPGKTDTIIDLVLDTVGALSAAAMGVALTRRVGDS